MRALGHLQQAFGRWRLADLTADEIEQYLRRRLKQHARVKTGSGFKELNLLKPTTVHQEFQVLRRTLSVAVRKKLVFRPIPARVSSSPFRSEVCSGRTTSRGQSNG